MSLEDRISKLMNGYKGTTKHITHYHKYRGYEETGAKLIDEGFDSRQVDDAIDEHGNEHWLRR